MTEEELYDRATREETYNEGVKATFAAIFLAYSKELRAEISKELLGLGVTNFGELTKGQLNATIRHLRTTQNQIYGKYADELKKGLEAYAKASGNVTRDVFDITDAPELAKLWAKVKNTPIPANGVYLDPFIKQFETSSIAEVENALRKAWVNGDSLQDTLAHIVGKSSKQGVSSIVQKIENRAASVAETAAHHVFTTSTASARNANSSPIS